MINLKIENKNGRSLLPESGADAPTVLSAVYTNSTPAKNRQADVPQYYNKELRPECEANTQLFSSDVYGKRYMSEKITSRCPQYGRSMIEMLGVLAIIGVLSVGGIAGYSKAMQKYRINKTIEQITLIAGNIRAFFAPQRNYADVECDGGGGEDCAIVRKAKLIPDEMIEFTNNKFKITNSFGGKVLITYDCKSACITNTPSSFNAFSLMFYNIPQEACIELVTQDWSNANVNVIYEERKEIFMKTPIGLDEAMTICSKNDATGNHIQFIFDIDVNSTHWQSILNPSS